MISKIFEKLVNHSLVGHLKKCSLFSDFYYSFKSDLLAVVSDRIDRVLKGPGATWAVALDTSKPFDNAWHVGLLPKLKSYEISGQLFDLLLSFLSNILFLVVLDLTCSQEYPVSAGVSQGFILGPKLFLPYVNYLPVYVICNIAIYVDDTFL